MVRLGKKRRTVQSIDEGGENDLIDLTPNNIDGRRELEMAAMSFRILELPTYIIYDILSRLPLKSIFACRCVCKVFLKLLKDPYFAELHLTKAPTTTASFVFQKGLHHQQFLSFYMLDLDHAPKAAPCSTDCYHGNCHSRNHPFHESTMQNTEFCFLDRKAALVGECNGLLCLYYASEPLYCICNPVLGEYVFIPYVTPSAPAYTYFNHSGFGYCPKKREYKVVRFTSLESVYPLMSSTSRKMVVEIHTLGSDSWRRFYDAPFATIQGSFDPFLNGCCHWITDSHKPSDLISSLDLERECFQFLPPPYHFNQHYVNKISWINVGILGGCLCVCYIYEDSQFEAWAMKDYGVKESWAREFSIDIKLYSGLRVYDLHRPLKYLNKCDIWFHCRANSLVSYNPRTGTFKDFEVLGSSEIEVMMFIPSFISLKHAPGGDRLKVQNLVGKRRAIFWMF